MRTLDLMRHVDRTRFQMEFCVLSGQPGDLDDEIRSLGGRVHLCPLGAGFPRRFQSLLRERRPGVVHSHVLYFSGYPLRLAARQGVPVRVAHFRSTGGEHRPRLIRSFRNIILRRWIDRFATDILAVSKGSMDEAWTRFHPADNRCQVIYNGLDTTPFMLREAGDPLKEELALDQDVHLYLHVGRFVPAKNHSRLIRVFANIVVQDSRAHLLLVGRGGTDSETRCREQVLALGLQERVTFMGARTDIPRLMRAGDLVLLPSLREGLPGVVLEACAAGVPVVASDLPGTAEIAAQFPDVTCLPLRASDAEWASVAVGALGTKVDQATALRRYQTSDFTLETSIDALTRVWTGAGKDDHGP